MKLFSKRNKNKRSERFGIHLQERMLVSKEIRNRFVSEVRYITSRDEFLEFFILFDNQEEKKKYLDKGKIDNFSLTELGYTLSTFFEFKDFTIIGEEREVRHYRPIDQDRPKKTELFFDDYILFDLLEILILFSKKDKRQSLVDRFNLIFQEEDSEYILSDYFIMKKNGEELENLALIFKDDNLKNKIVRYFETFEDDDYVNSSKLSADILNSIISGPNKNKKNEIEKLKNRLSNVLVCGKRKIDGKNRSIIKSIIESLLKNSQLLSNEVHDVRHTEQDRINVTNKNIYKLISVNNISLAELIITTLKFDYIMGGNLEKIKKDYIEKYSINPNERFVIKKPENPFGDINEEEEIDPADIHF